LGWRWYMGMNSAPKPRPIIATLGFSILIIHLFKG
jgi:hypothetical protein